MTTFDLIEELSKKPKKEIEYALLALLLKNKIDFIDLNSAYVDSLKAIKEDTDNKLIEAETCVLESLIYPSRSNKEAFLKSIHRRLYLLNKSKRFNVEKYNKKYEYNEEEAIKLSWYERNKELKYNL